VNYRKNQTAEVDVATQERAIGRAIDLVAAAREAMRDDAVEMLHITGIIADCDAILAGDRRPVRLVKQILSRAKALLVLQGTEDPRHAEMFLGNAEIAAALEWKANRKAAPVIETEAA
jgi:hypothetical protein